MKKILFVLFILLTLSACKGRHTNAIYVYNWGEYMDPEIIKDFEKETGIKVIYDTFEQNEDLYMKIKQGVNSYDIIIPSDYMIEKMSREKMLLKIDKKKLKNYKNIDASFLNKEFDPNNEYSIPYMWGTVGILYNKKLVHDKVDSWNILWNPKYKDQIIMMNSTRDSIGVALKKNGHSMNSKDKKELDQARLSLIQQKDLVLAYLVDEIKTQMVNESAALALMYSGDAIAAINENPNLSYVVPKEGSNLWFDSIAIPKDSQNIKGAYLFIDYLLRPDVAKKNVEFIEYSTPNKEAKKLLPKEIQQNQVAYPNLSTLPKMEVFRDPKNIIDLYEDIWADVKAH